MGHMTMSPEAAAALGHEPRACDAALSRAFEFLGKRWNGVLLGTLVHGPAGFAELKRGLGISDSVLSDRLVELTRAGLVERTVGTGPPVAVSYALTANGRAILPALRALTTWAQENLPAERCAGAGERQGRTSQTLWNDVSLRDGGPAPAGRPPIRRRAVGVSGDVDRGGAAHDVHQLQCSHLAVAALGNISGPRPLPGARYGSSACAARERGALLTKVIPDGLFQAGRPGDSVAGGDGRGLAEGHGERRFPWRQHRVRRRRGRGQARYDLALGGVELEAPLLRAINAVVKPPQSLRLASRVKPGPLLARPVRGRP
jgi:DNA-binding HxlR family transcriptional regulator